jgi:DNA-binding CsgD family transcriptional regulator
MAVMADGLQALTEKEKQTLRLLLEGHDAKSMARHLGLSVHTINERLRDARRKLSVSTSKEAARLLRQREAAPQSLGDATFGDAPPPPIDQQSGQPSTEPPSPPNAAWAIGGLVMIPFLVTLLALSAPTQAPQAGTPGTQPAGTSPTAAAAAPAAETAITRAASEWLALLDAGKWQESWAATGQSFRSLNTVDAWQAASEQARVPLGRMLSRQLLSEEDVPAPPKGYRMVRFRTDFENRRGATETVSLDREGDSWKVVGVYIE